MDGRFSDFQVFIFWAGSSIDVVKCSVLQMSRHSCCCCSNLFQVVILSIQLQCNGAHLLVAAKNVSTPARTCDAAAQ